MRRAKEANGEEGAAAPLRKGRRVHCSPAVQQVHTCSALPCLHCRLVPSTPLRQPPVRHRRNDGCRHTLDRLIERRPRGGSERKERESESAPRERPRGHSSAATARERDRARGREGENCRRRARAGQLKSKSSLILRRVGDSCERLREFVISPLA